MGSNLGSYIVSDKRKVIPKEVDSLAVWLEEYASSLFEIDIKNCLLPLNRIRSASVIQVRNRIKKDLTPDRNLIQSIDALDESYEILNLLSGRIVTWYSQTRGTHRIDIDSIIAKGLFPSGLNSLVKLFTSTQSMIVELTNYLDDNSPSVVPNLSGLLGSQLSARFLSLSGSLFKLARLPASTIQLLGAEKALFRHISDGSPPPKHGILYQHPLVKNASKKNKGKVSRKLAAKVAIASKLDYFGESNV